MRKIFIILITLFVLIPLSACSSNTKITYDNAYHITLNGDKASLDNKDIEEFDYTWHVDPSVKHDEVKDAPAEYYTGTKPDGDYIAYIDHELYYYPKLDENRFKLSNYDGENEWLYYYEDGENNDYIFATLPYLNRTFPTNMMHTQEEAETNKVLHIMKAGTYVLTGNWNGQINVDLGDKDSTFKDENAKVTIVLDNVNINCTVAPGIIINSAYECDNTWEDSDTHPSYVDTTNAGANVIIADDSNNTVSGYNIFRMLKTKYKDENSKDQIKVQKKNRKMDAAFYSTVSINVEAEPKENGTLTINSNFEGLDSELHMTIKSGNIIINSEDDGINVNEDNVSCVNFLGGNITLNAAKGAEGDGVDSNGYINIDGATLNINNIRMPDNALDSEDGIEYKSGKIICDGKEVSVNPGTYHEINSNGSNADFGGPQRGIDNNMNRPDGFNPQDLFKIAEIVDNFDMKEFKEKVNKLPDDGTLEDVIKLFGIDINDFIPKDPGEMLNKMFEPKDDDSNMIGFTPRKDDNIPQTNK